MKRTLDRQEYSRRQGRRWSTRRRGCSTRPRREGAHRTGRTSSHRRPPHPGRADNDRKGKRPLSTSSVAAFPDHDTPLARQRLGGTRGGLVMPEGASIRGLAVSLISVDAETNRQAAREQPTGAARRDALQARIRCGVHWEPTYTGSAYDFSPAARKCERGERTIFCVAGSASTKRLESLL